MMFVLAWAVVLTPAADPIKRESWSSWEKSKDRFSLPALLSSSVVDSWPAQLWTPESVLEKTGPSAILNGVYTHRNPIMGPYFDTSRVFNKLDSVVPRNPYEIVSMQSQHFFDHIFFSQQQKRQNMTYMYLSTSIDQVGSLC